MSLKLHQQKFSSRAGTPWCAMLLAVVYLAPVITGSSAPTPRFSDLPQIYQPATDISKAGIAGGTTVQHLTSNSLSQSGPNFTILNSTNGMESLDNKHLLAKSDRLSFRIVEDEEPPQALLVTDSGDLELPYIGRYPAVGKTCSDLAHAIKAELEKEYYYQATVIIAVDFMTKSRGKVYLVGPIRVPGPQDVPSDEVLTLSKAILRAGGFMDFADKRKVRVTRMGATAGDPEQTFTVNVEDVLEKGKIESDLPLLPGDLIYVPERLIRF